MFGRISLSFQGINLKLSRHVVHIPGHDRSKFENYLYDSSVFITLVSHARVLAFLAYVSPPFSHTMGTQIYKYNTWKKILH